MLLQPTMDKLRVMKLTGMADALAAQTQTPDIYELSFEERIGLLVDHEWTYRQDKRMARRLREAKLRLAACPEDLDYHQPRGLDRSVVRHLFTCQWIERHQNVLITGPTGAGKTFIACALAHSACRNGHSVRYYRISRLVSDLLLAKADGSYPKLLGRLARLDLLLLDDWGLATLTVAESRELLEILDDRSQAKSTIVTSQLPIENWHGTIADPTIADAILDRLVHNAHKLRLSCLESMRQVAAADKEGMIAT